VVGLFIDGAQSGPFVSLPQNAYLNLIHFKQLVGYPVRFCGITTIQHIVQADGYNLPGQTVFIHKPAALFFFSTLGEFCLQLVNFLLGFTLYEK
jgi:hypothetical protein